MNSVTKSWLSPRWTTIRGGDKGSVDSFGAIPEPEVLDLLNTYEDTVYSCAKWLSDTVSSVPLKVYVKTLPGQPEPKCPTTPVTKAALDHLANMDLREVVDHGLLTLLDHPNAAMNRNEMLRVIDIHLSLAGNAYLYKRREFHEIHDGRDLNDGLVEALEVIAPQHLEMVTDEHGHYCGWKDKRYDSPKFVPKEDLVWFKFVDPTTPYGPGYSPVRGVYERINLAKQELAYLAGLYRNQARPDSLVAIKDISPGEAERVQKELSQRFRQGGMGGPWVVNGEDVEAKMLNWSPKDVLGTELYQWTKLQIINAFGLNEGIFTTAATSYASADVARYMAMLNGVLPRLRLIEEQLNHQLVPEFDERLLIAFDDPVPENKEALLKEQTELLDRKVLTINEVRKMRGLPPVAWGDEPEGGEANAASFRNQGDVSRSGPPTGGQRPVR